MDVAELAMMLGIDLLLSSEFYLYWTSNNIFTESMAAEPVSEDEFKVAADKLSGMKKLSDDEVWVHMQYLSLPLLISYLSSSPFG